jgi:serine-type D-Ala-D-Ala carboxypeptidase/endopeptidase (penicillin-binding protein 4)
MIRLLRSIAATLLVLIAIVAFTATWVAGRTPSASALRLRSDATPILSARRVPQALRMGVARKRLSTAVTAALSTPELLGAKPTSCAAIEVDGALVVNENPTVGLLPASTMKTLTAAVALAKLEPTTTFTTEVRATVPAVNGQIAGDLWLVGGGDPLLETNEYTLSQQHDPEFATPFDKLVDNIVASGIKKIDGAIVGDDRRYDDERVRPTWKKNYLTEGEVGPIGALMIDDNFTRRNAKNLRVPAENAPADAAQLLRTMLEARGVTVGQPSVSALSTQPAADVIAPNKITSISSQPVTSIVREMLAWSDNTTAEMLVKAIGHKVANKGSWTDGLAAIKAELQARGVDVASLVQIDGSGLDRDNRVTCGVLLQVVRSEKVGNDYFNGLAVMGEYGTLRKRLRDTAATGKVHAKTGSLNGVSSLAGFAESVEKRPVLFALVFNGLASTNDGVNGGNAVSEALVAFPDAPVIDQFLPAP